MAGAKAPGLDLNLPHLIPQPSQRPCRVAVMFVRGGGPDLDGIVFGHSSSSRRSMKNDMNPEAGPVPRKHTINCKGL